MRISVDSGISSLYSYLQVDFSGTVDDEFLERLGLEKGTRKVVNHEERGRVLRAMDGCSYKAAAGGSLSNSLVALARLGCKAIGGPALNVAMAGSVGSDPLGGFYRLGSILTTFVVVSSLPLIMYNSGGSRLLSFEIVKFL